MLSRNKVVLTEVGAGVKKSLVSIVEMQRTFNPLTRVRSPHQGLNLKRYSLMVKHWSPKSTLLVQLQLPLIFCSCSLIRLECHIANVKILVQFQSRVFKIKKIKL